MSILEQILIKLSEPTEAQKDAGNYKKKHIRYNGMEISIENPAGSTRRGKSASGKEWSSHMYHHYGYIRGTMGKDKDHIDVFIKPGTKETDKVYVVNQFNKDKKFDEHKCMLGFTTEIAAKRAYLMNYEKGWDGLGSIVEMSIDDFKKWVYSGRKMTPAKQEKSMYKESVLNNIYNSSFNDELEKVAEPLIRKILSKIWSPAGNTGQLSSALRKRTLDSRQAVRKSLAPAKENMISAKRRITELRKREADLLARKEKLSNRGFLEKVVGGRFGTERRRLGKLQTSKMHLGATQKRYLPSAEKKFKSARSAYASQSRTIKPQLQKIRGDFAAEASNIRARRMANVATRTAIVGGGVYGGGSLIQSRMNNNNNRGYY